MEALEYFNDEEVMDFRRFLYTIRLTKELKNKNPNEFLSNRAVFYQDDFRNHTKRLGVLIKYENKEDLVVLDGSFRHAPKEVREAVVNHENVHEIGEIFNDDNNYAGIGPKPTRDEEKHLIVNTVAYLQSGNVFCPALPLICDEIHEYLNDTEGYFNDKNISSI